MRCGGQVVNVLTFYYEDPSLNPAEVCKFYCAKLFDKNKYE